MRNEKETLSKLLKATLYRKLKNICAEGEIGYLDHYSKKINNRKKKKGHTMTSNSGQIVGLLFRKRFYLKV